MASASFPRYCIDNPLIHKSLDEVDREARAFAKSVNPDAPDEELFLKAARIAYDRPVWETVRGLTQLEKKALRNEDSVGFRDQPKALQATIATLCLAAIVQGWTQTGGNGANQSWPIEFGIADSDGSLLTTRATLIFAGVNAVTYFAASLFGCWLSDPLQSMIFGRRGAIFISACLCLGSVIGAACTHSWQTLLACRAVLGLGMGAKASVVPIYGAEVSPRHLRGTLVMNWQLFDAFGIFLGFTANLIVSHVGPLAWRFQIASASLPTLCLLTLIWVIPESPRWLLKQDRLPEAFASLLQLRDTPLQAAIELFYANAQIQVEINLLPPAVSDTEAVNREGVYGLDQFQRQVKSTNYWIRIWQLFRNKRTRRATVAAFVVMISQQLCGVNVLQFFSSTFFRDVKPNQDPTGALWLSWGIGLANFVFTFPVYYFIDTRGRRFLLLTTYPWMALSMLAACLSFLIPEGNPARTAVIALFTFLFIFFYSWGQGPVPFAYSSEVFPLLNREAGMSFAVFVNLFGAGLLTLFVPQLTQALQYGQNSYGPGQARLLAVFAGFNVLAFLLIFFFVPETALAEENGTLKNISLEEVNYVFNVPTRRHIQYQVVHVVPWAWKNFVWAFKHYIYRDKTAQKQTLHVLYAWVDIRGEKAQKAKEEAAKGRTRLEEFEEAAEDQED